MTCASSSNIALLGSKVINLSFVGQELSNGVFISTVRPPQKKLGTRLTKLTVASQRKWTRQIKLLVDVENVKNTLLWMDPTKAKKDPKGDVIVIFSTCWKWNIKNDNSIPCVFIVNDCCPLETEKERFRFWCRFCGANNCHIFRWQWRKIGGDRAPVIVTEDHWLQFEADKGGRRGPCPCAMAGKGPLFPDPTDHQLCVHVCVLCLVLLWREVGQRRVSSKSDSRGRYGCCNECTTFTTHVQIGWKMQSTNNESISVTQGVSVWKPAPVEASLVHESVNMGMQVQIGCARRSAAGGRFSFYVLDTTR